VCSSNPQRGLPGGDALHTKQTGLCPRPAVIYTRTWACGCPLRPGLYQRVPIGRNQPLPSFSSRSALTIDGVESVKLRINVRLFPGRDSLWFLGGTAPRDLSCIQYSPGQDLLHAQVKPRTWLAVCAYQRRGSSAIHLLVRIYDSAFPSSHRTRNSKQKMA
jgi:hypothetical protein